MGQIERMKPVWLTLKKQWVLPRVALAFLVAMVGLCNVSPAHAQQVQFQNSTSESSTVRTERITTIRETTVTEKSREESIEEPVIAIFVKNRAGKIYDNKVAVFEDMLSSRLADMGFNVLSREDVINSVATFASEGANAGNANLAGANLDALLSNNTSALRLAQNMGADYLLTTSITTINYKKKAFKGYGVNRVILESILRASYKVLDRVKGGSATGGMVKCSIKSPFASGRSNIHAYAEELGTVDDLLDDASQKLAEHMEKKRHRIRAPKAMPGMSNWTVICGTTDLLVPVILKNASGEFVLGEHKLPVNPTNVTVELNGVVVGTAPGTFQVPPGLSKMRLSREGYKDIERTVLVSNGQTLRIDLHMTDKEYLKWKDMIAFLDTLKLRAKLTDAQSEAIRGYAQMLRQSGFKVDFKSDVKVNVDEKRDVKVDVKRDVKSDIKHDFKQDFKGDFKGNYTGPAKHYYW